MLVFELETAQKPSQGFFLFLREEILVSYKELRATSCHHIVAVGLSSAGLGVEEGRFQCCVL